MIFFDIDGTLIDHKKAELLGVYGFYHEYIKCFKLNEDMFYKAWCNISDRHFLRFLKGELTFENQRTERIKDVFALSGIKLSGDEAKEKFKTYRRIYEENLLPYEDVVPALNMLKGHKLGIITNGDLKQQTFKLERIEGGEVFRPIITAGEVGVSKPHKEIFEIACERAKVNIKDCIYVGDDYETDIISCTKAGMEGIWINRKREHKENSIGKMIFDLSMLNSLLKKVVNQ